MLYSDLLGRVEVELGGAEAHEALTVDERLERLEGGDEHVQAQVPLEPVQQQRVAEVVLRHRLDKGPQE